MVGALSLVGVGTSVSRTTTVTFSIPALTVLSMPERNISGKEVVVELGPADLAQGSLLIPLVVKSNVAWAVTARVLHPDGAELAVEVVGGPGVTVTTEESPILLGRPGKHEVLLGIKCDSLPIGTGVTLVLRIQGLGSGSPRG